MKKSIFIQITSYHDYELEKTIKDAIAKSSGETDLVFGVHSIYYEDNSWIEPVKQIPNVKLYESKAPDNLGMGFGRAIAHRLYSGEDYYLQIDAHSRFDPNWDTFLINEINKHKANGFKKPLISQYPKVFFYEGDEEKTRDHEEPVTQFYWKSKERFKENRTPMQGTVVNPEGNVFSISVSGGSIFTEGEFLKPNELIFADGEEIFMAARAYTHGYDLFVPSEMFMYHLYYGPEGKNARRTVYADWPEKTHLLGMVSTDEIRLVLSGNGLVGEGRLGTERTLAEYGEFCGLDFVNGEILDNYYEF
jgi:GT2 family glycosyltransferase